MLVVDQAECEKHADAVHKVISSGLRVMLEKVHHDFLNNDLVTMLFKKASSAESVGDFRLW